MKTVVITGSTRGVGYGLADSFLALGCAVVINGRTQAGVDGAVDALAAAHPAGHILGQPGDVTDAGQVQALWDAAQARFGRVDIWVNNAGMAHAPMPFHRLTPAQMRAVVQTNLLGTMHGSSVAINGMLAQGFGSLYNMEGLGSDGRQVDGLSLYGSSKRAVHYLNRALVAECRDTPVRVGMLSPGMVVTDMLVAPYRPDSPEWERARRVFNILADRVETVAPWMARQMLANQKHGARLKWLTRPKIIGRFLMAPFQKRDLFADL